MGCYDFHKLLANQIYDKMRSDKNWVEVDARGAQKLANEGCLVIAGWKNPDGHGHVAVVRPGEPYYSNSWGGVAPKVMNIGTENFINRSASYAFSKERMPKFFAYNV